MRRLPGGIQCLRNRLESRRAVFMRVSKIDDPAILRRAPGRLVRIGEETDRRLGANQDQLFDALQKLDGLLGEIRDSLDLHETRPPLASRRKPVARNAGAGCSGNAPRGGQSALLQRGSPNQNQRLLSGLECFGDLIDGIARH